MTLPMSRMSYPPIFLNSFRNFSHRRILSIVIASGLSDWAGEVTRYRYAGPDGCERSTEVSWKGHARAVEAFVGDLKQTRSTARFDFSALAAVGHRVVHGGPFTSSVRITPDIRAQISALADLAPALAASAERAVSLGLEELSSTAPELELFALAHARSDVRLFAS